ncbi:MAG TPA: peptidoglycan DD-metalloendopeptidase family protein [Stellaceae bacterium]|nr:peptidoglycan DD-metalloendopeptidase family protein [Stellaceae bacterium]
MPRPERFRLATLPLLLAGLLICATARADDTPQQQLKSVQQQLEDSRAQAAEYARQAEALAAEIATLRANSIAAAKAAQEHEAVLSALEDQLATLNTAAAQKAAELQRHRAAQQQLLMALERLARNPPEGLALTPGNPVDAMRSAVLMGAAVPPLAAEARRLSQEIDELAAVRRQIAADEARHRAERLGLEQEQTQLDALIARKAVLQEDAQHGAEESGERQLQLAAQASDLRQLIEKLDEARRERDAEAERQREAEEQRRAEAERRESEQLMALQQKRPDGAAPSVIVTAPPPVIPDPSKPPRIRPFREAHGALVYPASGRLMRRFGENDDFGMASKGLTFETRPGAQVVAPFDGRVLFAGPFKGYGQILIIEHGDGYHSLLAGLDRVEGTVGQWLVAGEPVGTMPRGEEKPHLYLELRHDGQPINPLPWLATHDEKVSG